ncbi:unnamed protein product [Darwinula stevensoni]|uniref:Uncharacterized protein n=1 Tax=Darwinula stevensoni TaxID=69355 RepID=A0A7R9AFU0_9CRUS|nr:unnamed protein product [Darwinula stevensoni]CAG0903172.1 unnamed protein product [Darwinula stevensoni]
MGCREQRFHLVRNLGAIQKQDTVMREAIPAKLRLALTLRYLAPGEADVQEAEHEHIFMHGLLMYCIFRPDVKYVYPYIQRKCIG